MLFSSQNKGGPLLFAAYLTCLLWIVTGTAFSSDKFSDIWAGIILFPLFGLFFSAPGLLLAYILLRCGYGRPYRPLPTMGWAFLIAVLNGFLWGSPRIIALFSIFGLFTGFVFYMLVRRNNTDPFREVVQKLTSEQISTLTAEQIAEIKRKVPDWTPPS